MLLIEEEAKQTALSPPLNGNKQTKAAARSVSPASFLGSKVQRQLGVAELISPVRSLHYLSSCSRDTEMGERLPTLGLTTLGESLN